MNEKPVNPPHVTTAPKPSNSSKWLIGGAIAALLAVGSYFAWSNSAPQTDGALQTASYDASGAPMHAGPLAQPSGADDAAARDESAAASARTQTRTAAVQRRARVSFEAPAEEVVGVLPASADASDADAIVVEGARRPVWASAPTARRLAAVYPAMALERGRDGEAQLRCTVVNNGALDCAPVSEYPARAGFGTAALRVAHMYRHAEQRADGSSAVGTPVNMRVVFRIPEEDRRRG